MAIQAQSREPVLSQSVIKLCFTLQGESSLKSTEAGYTELERWHRRHVSSRVSDGDLQWIILNDVCQ